jgi:hypothetical protein
MRQAIASGEFPRALLLWNEYVSSFAEAARRREVGSAQWSEFNEFVAWARNMALCSRAYAQDRLNSLHVTSRYGEYAPAPRPSIVHARF